MTPKQQQQRGRWLLAAIQEQRIERALELIRQGTGLSGCSPNGTTALYAALAHSCYAVVKPLLEAGADPNMPDPRGSYPIHIAAEYGGTAAPQLVEALIAYGARIDARDEEGATAIFLAGKNADAETIYTLQRHGADISDRNNERDTALIFACCWGMTEPAILLLDAGIDLEAQDDRGMTALHWAALGGYAGTVALLLARGARVDVPDQRGRTALMYAAEHGSLRCVTRLLEAGSDPHASDGNGQTALDATRRYASRDLAEALLAEETAYNSGTGRDQVVERIRTPDGEPAVRVTTLRGKDAYWTRERGDGFDAIVQLLQQHPRVRGTG